MYIGEAKLKGEVYESVSATRNSSINNQDISILDSLSNSIYPPFVMRDSVEIVLNPWVIETW